MDRIRRVGEQPASREAVALGLVDSLLAGDNATLVAALDALRNARASADGDLAGWLDAVIAFAHSALERAPSIVPVAPGTQAHDFISALADTPPLGSADLARLLDTDDTQVSRTGRRLLEGGLVTRRKVGRQVFWQLTPRGRSALEETPRRERSRHSEFWQEALRRGFDSSAGGDDPTRERIVESALELHNIRGIRATTWQEIAAKAAVPVATVEELFPTLDDLVRACGSHFMSTLRLPPSGRASEVFVGASSQNERIDRMVKTLFGAY